MESGRLILWIGSNEHRFILGQSSTQPIKQLKLDWQNIENSQQKSSYSIALRYDGSPPHATHDLHKNITMAEAARFIESWQLLAVEETEEEQDLDYHW
ncbi:hypothetical protein [Vibrio barjaei]|jgi:hypothetical protein|uniref:Uncharacterized protein n=1 Tax=Vibrio barjaei TaxID=1676683 RepID=A0ABW7IGG8_9VIBR|nr:hypothetical protein [Vibrio barjaei]MCG9787676.1 hypothetical protein [Vibrio mediterranei]MCY9872079.1 hypothetical protein [Vibrio barjaei]OIN26543.1 hypothetical protein AWH66_2023955 [Vibrio barjaei]